MKLYVCWGTWATPRPGGHPCANAHIALEEAGYEPEVIKVHGLGLLGPLGKTDGRKMLEKETGSKWVPALQTDDGEWITDSKKIIAWAEKHPASVAGAIVTPS